MYVTVPRELHLFVDTKWKDGNVSQAYVTGLSNGTDAIYSDVIEEKGGAEPILGPHDLPEAAYAPCLNMTVRMVLDAMNVSYGRIAVKVELDRSNDAKTAFSIKSTLRDPSMRKPRRLYSENGVPEEKTTY